MIKKIVFTGGFSSGKTTTIKLLQNMGYSVILESSEALIRDFIQKKGHYPWEDKVSLLDFHKEVFQKQLENEKSISEGVVFLDRSLIDRLAFLEFDDLKISKNMFKSARPCSYYKVLFFKNNESIYKKDLHRPHNIKDSN